MDWALYDAPDLAGLEREWSAAASYGGGSVFQTFALARHWAEIFAPTHRLRIWVDTRTPRLVPLATTAQGLTLLGNGLFDYLDLIGAPETGEPPPGDGVHFAGLPGSSPHLDFWRQWIGAPQFFSPAPVRRPGAPEQLIGEHPRTYRRWQAAQAAGVELEPVTDAAERARVAGWLLRCKNDQLAEQGRASVLGELEQRWVCRMVEAEPQIAELWCLRRAGTPLSALLCWRWGATRYAYTVCYERGAAALSPGILLVFAVLLRTLAEGAGFDFLTGGQAFKQRFATHATELLQYPPQHG